MSEGPTTLSDAQADAARGIIDLWITPSMASRKAMVRANPHRLVFVVITIFSRIGAFSLAAFLTWLVFLALDMLAQPVLKSVVLIITGGIIGLVIFRALVEGRWKRRTYKALQEARPFRVVGDGHMLTIEDKLITLQIAFSGIDHLVEKLSHLVIIKDGTVLLALPKTAFGSPQIFEAFATFLRGSLAARDSHETNLEKTS